MKNINLKSRDKLQKTIKGQNGSITIFVLVSIMFFAIVLIGLYTNSSYKIQKQQKEIEQIQKQYQKTDIEDIYEEAYDIFKKRGNNF